jgi:hypothetical protein
MRGISGHDEIYEFECHTLNISLVPCTQGLRGVDGNLHFPVPSINPSLQHFQFCRFWRSLGIPFLSFF